MTECCGTNGPQWSLQPPAARPRGLVPTADAVLHGGLHPLPNLPNLQSTQPQHSASCLELRFNLG
eukprot:1160178-Pelagomonas_calceolata.AAC.6